MFPKIPFDSAPDLIKGMPADLYLGEAVGVATILGAHLYLYAKRFHECDDWYTQLGLRSAPPRACLSTIKREKYVCEIGHNLYGFVFAQAKFCVDPQDTFWVIDEGSKYADQVQSRGSGRYDHGQKAGGD